MDLAIRHYLPGRVRLHVPELCRKPSLADAAVAWLRGQTGIRAARLNMACASLVVEYDASRELLLQTRDGAVGALAHSRVDLEWLVRASNPDRRHGAERMTRVSFGLREPDGGGFCPPGVQCERAELRGHISQLPLSLMVELARTAEGSDRGAVVEAEYLVFGDEGHGFTNRDNDITAHSAILAFLLKHLQ